MLREEMKEEALTLETYNEPDITKDIALFSFTFRLSNRNRLTSAHRYCLSTVSSIFFPGCVSLSGESVSLCAFTWQFHYREFSRWQKAEDARVLPFD